MLNQIHCNEKPFVQKSLHPYNVGLEEQNGGMLVLSHCHPMTTMIGTNLNANGLGFQLTEIFGTTKCLYHISYGG